jgi:hypothetical protein
MPAVATATPTVEPATQQPAATAAPTTAPTPTPEPTIEYPPVVEGYYADIAIVGTDIFEDGGESLFKVVYDYTNKTEGLLAFAGRRILDADAYQNGEQLASSTSATDGSEETRLPDGHIAPGVTARTAKCYVLLDTEAEVTIVIPPAEGDDVEIILDPKNLLPQQPRPERKPSLNPPLETENFLGEEHTFEYTSSGAECAFHIRLLGPEFFEEAGDKYIRIRYEITNSKREDSLRIAGYLRSNVMQDGISLGEPEWENRDLMKTDEDKAISTRLEPDESVIFALVYKLQSDTPVLVQMGDEYWSHNEKISPPYIGGLFPVK